MMVLYMEYDGSTKKEHLIQLRGDGGSAGWGQRGDEE